MLIVWGERHARAGRGRDGVRALIGANARRVVFDDTGHVPMIERPTRFNALLAEFLAGDAGARVGRRGRQRVTAPSDALDTSFAYLPRTPSVTDAGAS